MARAILFINASIPLMFFALFLVHIVLLASGAIVLRGAEHAIGIRNTNARQA